MNSGSAVSFDIDDHREVGYWIDRAFWGRGVASAALGRLLDLERYRPLYGHVARTNLASRKVLEKSGFTLVREADDGITLVLMK